MSSKTIYTCDGCGAETSHCVTTFPPGGGKDYCKDTCWPRMQTAFASPESADLAKALSDREYYKNECVAAIKRAGDADKRADRAEGVLARVDFGASNPGTGQRFVALTHNERVELLDSVENLNADAARLRDFIGEIIAMLGKKRRQRNAERLREIAVEVGERAVRAGANPDQLELFAEDEVTP